MTTFMKIGDIWQYGPDEEQNIYICLGIRMIEGDTFYRIYKLTDAEFTNVYEYSHYRFVSAVGQEKLKLLSRVSKDA